MASVSSHLSFDPTDANTIAASATIGSYVLAGDDGTKIGHVSDALKVNFSNASLAVTATDLDIRDLAFGTDSVDVSGSSVTVTATQLDIDDLDAASDSVAAWLNDGTGNAISSTAGALNVNIASGSISFTYDYAEDAAAASGDVGAFVLAVRQDTLATSTSTDGDYAAFKVNAKGELYMKDADVLAELQGGIVVSATDLDIRDLDAAQDSVESWLHDGTGNAISSTGGSLDVNVTNDIDIDDDLANTAIQNTTTAVSTTAVNIVASALADRKWVALANEGNIKLFFGKNGVTTSNGFPLYKGAQQVWRIGAAVAPQIIGGTGASNEDLSVMELS